MQCPFHNLSKYDVLPSVSLMLLIPSTLVFETHLFVFTILFTLGYAIFNNSTFIYQK